MSDETGAIFSRCRTWRYTLYRQWGDGPTMNCVGLNPSTATEHVDDPTIRRMRGFAKSLGCGRLVVTNLFAYRATDPKNLLQMRNFAQGVKNDEHILEQAQKAQIVVAAWGVHGSFRGRGEAVLKMLDDNGVIVHCFGLTKDGYPRHPLYLAKNTPLDVWQFKRTVSDEHPSLS